MHKENVNTCVLNILYRTNHKEKHWGLKKNIQSEAKDHLPTQRQFDVTQVFREGNYTGHGSMEQYESKAFDTMQNTKTGTTIKGLAFLLLMIWGIYTFSELWCYIISMETK